MDERILEKNSEETMDGKVNSHPAADPDVIALSSLFEGSFSIDWLVELTGLKSTQILNAMEEGVRQGCLTRQAPGIYLFASSKKREVWRNRFSEEEKSALHRKIAELLLRELPDDEEKPLLMLEHLHHLPNVQEKCFWLMKAGDHKLRKYHTEEALQCYTRALDGLSALSNEESDSLFCEIAVKYSRFSVARYDTKKVYSILRDALGRAQKWNKPQYLALLKMHLAKNEWLLSRYSSAMKHFEQGWAIAQKLQEPSVLRSATNFSAFFKYWQGRFREVIESYEKFVSDVARVPQRPFPLWATVIVGRCYFNVGQVTQGLGMLDSIRTFCLEKGDHDMAAHANCTMGAAMVDIFRLPEALGYVENSLADAHKEKNSFVEILGKPMLAYIHYLNDDKERAVRYLKKYLEHSRQVHVSVIIYPYLMELCWAMEQDKLPAVSGLSLAREVNRMKGVNNIFLKGVAYRYDALRKRNKGRPYEEILQSLRLSLELLEESGHQIELARSQFETARVYGLIGNREKARELALQAFKILAPFGPAMVPDDLKALIANPPSAESLLKEILQLTQEVAALRDEKSLFHHILSSANRITGAERGAIFLWEDGPSGAELRLRASKNLTSEHIHQASFLSSMRMIEKVGRTGKGQILESSQEQSVPGPSPANFIRSCIFVPMMLRDKPIGVLYLDNRLFSSVFKEFDLELLSYFGAQAAIALDNAKVYLEIQRLNQKLQEEKLYYEEQHLQSLHFEDIVGESPAILQVLKKIDQVAKTDTSVLILGETGVGKELVARAIHEKSHRKEKPFIRVFCSALPESLLPTELFGHEKGAFTGADSRRVGRFELADGGTIFLDEIGDLPMEVQVRLLRVLQSREFERVGGTETLRSDFRLVAATNRDLEQAVRAGRFRLDLYYRLNVFPVFVPPLRERKEDIPLLALYFLKIYATKIGKTFEGIPKSEMDKLVLYDWPGNVRELENLIERGVILSPGPMFRVPELGGRPTEIHPGAAVTLNENERRHILWTLQKTGWKVRGRGGAAELLDIHPSTLAFRMKRLGIKRPSATSAEEAGT